MPLKDVLMSSDSSHIDAVDLFLEFHSDLGKECVVDLMHGINAKLRVVDLQDLSLGKEFLWSVFTIYRSRRDKDCSFVVHFSHSLITH